MPRVVGVSHSRREAQILEILYRRGRATVADLRAELPDPPSPSAVRKLLDILEQRGHVRHVTDDGRHVYTATVPLKRARQSALRQLLDTFFAGSAEGAMVALLDISAPQMSAESRRRVMRLAKQAMGEGR
jgi:BlaI family penicillinase repressor